VKATFELARMQGAIHQPVMLLDPAVERLPSHPFRLLAVSVKNARLPSQPYPDLASLTGCLVTRVLVRTGVGKFYVSRLVHNLFRRVATSSNTLL
jgi:hypothetical protein